jgi:hypothetical protein
MYSDRAGAAANGLEIMRGQTRHFLKRCQEHSPQTISSCDVLYSAFGAEGSYLTDSSRQVNGIRIVTVVNSDKAYAWI